LLTDILPRFLDLKLFDIGGDDERLARLRAAAGRIAENLKAQRQRAPQSVMVALDPRVSGDDPVLVDVAAAVSEQWTTYLSVFADRPVIMFRAILMEAIRLAQEDDAGIAAAAAFTARNLLPRLAIGAEKDIVRDVLGRSDELMAPEIDADWRVPSSASASVEGVPVPAKMAKLDRKVLLTKIEAAVGPQAEKGEALTSPNQHWPNAGQPWSNQFSPRMTTAIAESVDAMADVVSNAWAKRDQAMGEAMSAAQASPGAMQILDRRLNLVWWRQSLYSPSARRGYREMPPLAAAAQMASDVFRSVPPFSPQSVEYFLREAVVEVVGEKKGRTASDSFRQVAAELIKLRAQTALGLPKAAVGKSCRRPLISLLCDENCDAGDIERALGVPDSAKISLADLAVWILRELLAHAAVESAAA
jgi:GTPase-associated system helical domain